MDASSMITLLRTQTYTDANNLPDATALQFINFSYKKRLANLAQDVNQDYWSEIFSADSVAWQSEYLMPVKDSVNPGASNVTMIEINYVTPTVGTGTVTVAANSRSVVGSGTSFTTMKGQTLDVANTWRGVIVDVTDDTHCTVDNAPKTNVSGAAFKWYYDNWQKARSSRMADLPKSESYYRANQPTTSPKFAVFDNSIFIYPYTTSVATQAVRFYGVRNYPDLVLLPTPTTPAFDDNFHYSIVIGAKKFVFDLRGMDNKAEIAKKDDKEDLEDLENMMGNRNLGPFTKDLDPTFTKQYE